MSDLNQSKDVAPKQESASTMPQREDRRRELTMWVLVSASVSDVSANEMFDRFELTVVEEHSEPTALEASEYYRIRRFEDDLPDSEEWAIHSAAVRARVEAFDLNAAGIDEAILKASPRWRIARMPVVDRSLLRLGVTELLFLPQPRPRATINGCIELAKRYGEKKTPKFVNGILDQVRRDAAIPFK
ncbi:MAG: transcription antitermination factor NusB [Bradymonadia bacterium]